MIDLLLRAFPRKWRDRYGDELGQLLSDAGITPSVAIDLVRAGLGERVRGNQLATPGGVTVTLGPAYRHPTGWAAAAFALIVPTSLFVASSILTYQLGFSSLANLMDPISEWLGANGVVDVMLVGAPVVALLLAVAPLLRFEMRDRDAGREAVVGVRWRAANVAVIALALVVGGLLVGHIVAETVPQVGA